MINDLQDSEDPIMTQGVLMFISFMSIGVGLKCLYNFFKDKQFKCKERHILTVNKFIKKFNLIDFPQATDEFLNSILHHYNIKSEYSKCSTDCDWKHHQIYNTPIMNPNDFQNISYNVWRNINTLEILEENINDSNYKLYKIDKYTNQYNLNNYKYIRWNGVHN